MSLMTVVKFGYTLVIVSLILMIWASLSGAREFHGEPGVKYPPCDFNSYCSCSKSGQDLGIVMCRSVPLFRVPQPINNSKVYMLHLEDNGLRDIEPYFFKSTGLYRLAIHKNPLEEIPDEAFFGLERNLRELELHENGLVDVPTRALRNMHKLELLDLRGNHITDISSTNWDGLRNSLQTLILAKNSIIKLPPDAFTGLPNLQTLDLRENHLSHIDINVFRSGMNRLHKFLLSDNQFSMIPYKELSSLKQLRHLDLSKNRISQIPPNTNLPGVLMSLDVLRLDFNVITYILPGSFKYFSVVNTTVLDGNPLSFIREDAFREAKIRILSLRDCGLTEVSPAAFAGLEVSLFSLDLSVNNLTGLPSTLFHHFENLRYLNLHENQLRHPIPTDSFSGFQYALFSLDLTGSKNGYTSLQDLRRMRSLRSLSVSKLSRPTLISDDFQEFGVDLDELRIVRAHLDVIQAHAFRYLRTIKLLDLSENSISKIDRDAFVELGHGLMILKMTSALADSVRELPHEAIKPLAQLTHLDFSNNRIVILPDTSFHFLTNLRRLELQDNLIEYFHKGTLQGDIHAALESVILSVNRLKRVTQHTFVDLPVLKDLEMEDNLIERIDRRAFINCNRLRRISLRGNKLRNITEEAFQNLPSLEDLDLSYNHLNTFEFAMFDQVGTLTSLSVNASHNKINRLTDSIAAAVGTIFRDPAYNFGDDDFIPIEGFGIGNYHSNIKILDLSYNNISYISRSFFSSAEISISHLYLSHNKLRNATRDVFGNMPHLQYLDLSHNQLFEMDFDVFSSTKRLQIIYLSNNLLDELPPDIFKSLQSLRVVDLANNHIKFLPDNLFSESGLEKLDLSNNELTRIPSNSLTHDAAYSLTALDLSGNHIPTIGATDFSQKPRSLAWLDLSNNRLIRLEPQAFMNVPKLSWLDLSHNGPLSLGRSERVFHGIEHTLVHLRLRNISLTTVPLLPLPSLRYLDLSHNDLPILTSDIANNLTQLRSLDLSYNDLPSVPIVTHSLSKLRWLALSGNPISSLTNTSLLGVAEKLEFLDISGLRLNTLELGALSKMQALRSLVITAYSRLRDFNLPNLLSHNGGLKDLWVYVEDDKTNMGIEMLGNLPAKLENITFSGKALRSLGDNVLSGVSNKNLRFALRNTSITAIQRILFLRADRIRNLTLDLRHNRISKVFNPSTSDRPDVPGKVFLQSIFLEDNPLNCDCELGWIEVWERKRRQFICTDDMEPNCMTMTDDLRSAKCNNKSNNTLIDVLKNDIECGWNDSSQPTPLPKVVYILCIVTAVFLYI